MACGDVTTERWLPVPGWEGVYSVSSEGRVRRDAPGTGTAPGRITSGRHYGDGYSRCALVFTPTRPLQKHLVHRLVAAAFLGPCPPGWQVDHVNGVRHDNRLSNLRYGTPRDNARWALERLGPWWANVGGGSNGRARIAARDARAAQGWRAVGVPTRIIGMALGVTSGHAWQITSGRRWRRALGHESNPGAEAPGLDL